MRKSFVLLLLICFSVCLISCGYEDTNGDNDYTLQSITDDTILKGGSFSESMSSHIYINNKWKDSVKSLNGVKELNAFNGPFKIVLSLEVSKGNAKLVICTDDEILHEFKVNEENQEYVCNYIGKVYIKIAGESCGFKSEYEVYFIN